jgi:hypothetical protein
VTALTTEQQEMLDLGLNTIPVIFRSAGRQREEMVGFAVQAAALKSAVSDLLDMALLGTATSDTADWPDLIAQDYGTRRMNGESTETMRIRVPASPTGVIRSEILQAIQDILAGAGITGTVGMVELPRDAAYAGTWRRDAASTGGTFSVVCEFVPAAPPAKPFAAGGSIVFSNSGSSGNDGTFTISAVPTSAGVLFTNATAASAVDAATRWTYAGQSGIGGTFAVRTKFTPTRRFAYPPYVGSVSGLIESVTITFSGCSAAGNDGTFAVSGLAGNAVLLTNATSVAGADATATWTTDRIERGGGSVEGRAMAYADRGYRAWRGAVHPATSALYGIIVILPYGTTETLARSCAEQLRRKKAAGIQGFVERRTSP